MSATHTLPIVNDHRKVVEVNYALPIKLMLLYNILQAPVLLQSKETRFFFVVVFAVVNLPMLEK